MNLTLISRIGNLMRKIYDRLREAIPTARFFPPSTPEQIARVENALNFRFPDWLRDLYLHCNGILSADSSAVYLYALECNDDFRESILSWNQFLRAQWLENLPEFQHYRPEVDWSKAGPHELLIFGSDGGTEWAIHEEGGMEIVRYDVRNPGFLSRIAPDLVDACIEHQESSYAIEEELFRGRKLYRGDNPASLAATDIDRLFDIIVALHKSYDSAPEIRVSTGWWLHRATSQRPGELGELFIIPIGIDDEIRIFTRDGNLPFVMRLTVRCFKEDLCCVVGSLKGALMNILATKDAISGPWINGKRPRPSKPKLSQIWQDVSTRPRPELIEMADRLCSRDSRRRIEENRKDAFESPRKLPHAPTGPQSAKII